MDYTRVSVSLSASAHLGPFALLEDGPLVEAVKILAPGTSQTSGRMTEIKPFIALWKKLFVCLFNWI